jgi:hypothetical protein
MGDMSMRNVWMTGRSSHVLLQLVAALTLASAVCSQTKWTVRQESRTRAEDTLLIAMPGAATVAPDGSFYLIDRKNATVIAFSPNAESIWKIGGQGRGPKEFVLPHPLGVRRDTLWVYDGILRRFSYYSKRGALLHTVTIARDPDGMFIRNVFVLSDGSMFAEDPRPSPTGTTDGGGQDLIRFAVAEGKPITRVDTVVGMIFPREVLYPWGISPAAGSTTMVMHPWPLGPRYTVSPDGSRYAVVDPVEGKGYRLTEYTPSGKRLFETNVKDKPVPITGEMINAWARSTASGPYKPVAKSKRITETALANLLEKTVGEPKYLSPASDVLIASDSYTWVSRER